MVSQFSPRGWRAAAALALVLALGAALAGTAQAKLAHTRHGTIAYTPPRHRHRTLAEGLGELTPEEELQQYREEEEAHGPLTKGKGPVMKTDTNYLIVWQPRGAKFPAHYVQRIDEYLRNIAAYPGGTATERTNTESELAKYGVKKDYYGGLIVDRRPFPESGCGEGPVCMTDPQLQHELERVVRENGLPADLTRAYNLLLPVGVHVCFEEAGETACSVYGETGEFCEYHSAVEGSGGRDLLYSVEPFVFPSGCAFTGWLPQGEAASGTLDGLSHEHSETTTDPLPPSGWIGSEEWEIGDICSYNYGTPIGETANHEKFGQLINGQIYGTQMEWSNKAGKCVQHA